jgi:predicted nucleotide-binding protein
VIPLNDIEQIKIRETLYNSSERTSLYRTSMPKKTNFQILNETYIINEGKDVTDDFIKGAPGYKKNKLSENIEEIKSKSNQVFVVHGHDNGMKEAVARTLEKLDLKPIILHEKPNQNRTIIEKFTEYADSVSFAIVLLSPDDVGYEKDRGSETAKSRARQNVILELGFFIGKLGKSKVTTLFKNNPDFELPSDYIGVLYTTFDEAGRWQFDLAKELKSAGYNIDVNKLLN